MAKSKTTTKKTVTRVQTAARTTRGDDSNYLDRIETEIKSNQSTLSLVLGILIVIVLGVLVFNYFNKSNNEPAIQEASTENQQSGDVSPENLPGKYTVKEGDTLFIIADKYYKDGNKYSELVKANTLQNENAIEVGQVLDVPKLEADTAMASSNPSDNNAMASASPTPTQLGTVTTPDNGMGGGDTTIWGPNIHENTYTVAEGDWLSTIAARAYGDIMSYQKIAEANNITDPNVIEPGTVLKLPR